MSVKYVCRYCRSLIGEIPGDGISELQLGFHFLTPAERRDIISYNREGDVTVTVLCDYCQEALDQNPELCLTHPIQ